METPTHTITTQTGVLNIPTYPGETIMSFNSKFLNVQQQGFNAPDKKPIVEDMFSKIMDKIDKTTEQVKKRFEVIELKIQNHDSILKNLEHQVGQIYGILSQRQAGHFPSDTERNPKEQVNMISLRSGRQLEERSPEVVSKEKEDEEVPENNEVLNEEPSMISKLDFKET